MEIRFRRVGSIIEVGERFAVDFHMAVRFAE